MANIPDDRVISITDNFLDVALLSIERAQQHSHYTIAGGGKHPCGYPEQEAKRMLQTIGMVLATGGECPDNIKRWLGKALVEFSESKKSSKAFCLPKLSNKPHKMHTYIYAVNTEALCLLGMPPSKAATLVADIYGEKDKNDPSIVITDNSTIIKAHNELVNRRGLFNGLKSTFLQAIRYIYDPNQETLTQSLSVPLPDEIIKKNTSPESIWDNISLRIKDFEKKKGRYLGSETIQVPPESPNKIINGDYDIVSLELIFPNFWIGEVLSQKPKSGEHSFYDDPSDIDAIKEELYLIDEARKELRTNMGSRTKRRRAIS